MSESDFSSFRATPNSIVKHNKIPRLPEHEEAAVAYIRVRKEDHVPYEVQEKNCIDMASFKKFYLRSIYIDKNEDEQIALRELLSDIIPGEHVICYQAETITENALTLVQDMLPIIRRGEGRIIFYR